MQLLQRKKDARLEMLLQQTADFLEVTIILAHCDVL
jgi:hypothetical protein